MVKINKKIATTALAGTLIFGAGMGTSLAAEKIIWGGNLILILLIILLIS